MKFRSLDPSGAHFVDDETGIEFLEKDWPERVKQWTREGEDRRLFRPVTFVFRDPNWTAANGSHDTEFQATSRFHTVERKDRTTPRIFTGRAIHGFDIPAQEFEQKFNEYTKGSAAKLTDVRDFVREAIAFYLGSLNFREVNFV